MDEPALRNLQAVTESLRAGEAGDWLREADFGELSRAVPVPVREDRRHEMAQLHRNRSGYDSL